MERLIDKIEQVLRRAFPRCAVDLDWDRATSTPIHGFVVWKGFDGMDTEARVDRLSNALDAGLDGPDRQRVSMIFPLTPLEMRVRDEDRAREEEVILAAAAQIRRDRRRKQRRVQRLAAHARPARPTPPALNGNGPKTRSPRTAAVA